jgi:hypothetical protein
MTTGQERPTNNRTESRHGYFNSLSRDVHPFLNRHHLSPQIRPRPASLEVAVSEMRRWGFVNTHGLVRSQELFLAGRVAWESFNFGEWLEIFVSKIKAVSWDVEGGMSPRSRFHLRKFNLMPRRPQILQWQLSLRLSPPNLAID